MLSSTQGVSTAAPTQVDSERVLLEALGSQLDKAMRSLAAGEAQTLQEVSCQVSSTAEELLRLISQISHLPASNEAWPRRQRVLSTLREQSCVCRAMLRRWRRALALRRQLLALCVEPAPYTESLALPTEQR